MCAIFGFVARDDNGPNIKRLQTIVRANIGRGPHAFGLAWVDARGRTRMYKQTGRMTDYLGVLAMARDASMVIGHLRWATQGDFRNNLNNHPHPADGGWIVHNGIVHNYRELVIGKRLWPVSECDSEALGLLIERGTGTLSQRMARAVRSSEGALAMMGLWGRPATLIGVRRGNPLHVSGAVEGVYLATLADGLNAPVPVADDQLFRLTRRGGKILTARLKLPAEPRRRFAACDQMDFYRGG